MRLELEILEPEIPESVLEPVPDDPLPALELLELLLELGRLSVRPLAVPLLELLEEEDPLLELPDDEDPVPRPFIAKTTANSGREA